MNKDESLMRQNIKEMEKVFKDQIQYFDDWKTSINCRKKFKFNYGF